MSVSPLVADATSHTPASPQQIDALAEGAAQLGFEIVEVSGTLDAIDEDSREQLRSLDALKAGARRILAANQSVSDAVAKVRDRTKVSEDMLHALVDEVRRTAPVTQELATWVAALETRIDDVADMLAKVRKSNEAITSIAGQVNILAINAKIEAARAGDAGRGFAVVAEEVNALSHKTSSAAKQISGQVENLSGWIDRLTEETRSYSRVANDVHSGATRTDEAVENVRESVEKTQTDAQEISDHAGDVRQSGDGFAPAFSKIGEGAADTATRINATRERLHTLIELSETLVQGTVAIGGASTDAPFIDRVLADAAELGRRLERAVSAGEIAETALFDRSYHPISGTDPVQLLAPYTDVTDRHFPEVQEAALAFDDRVVFCAAIDTNGYLPTHNKKFSRPQGRDPVWNAANARNRRIFDDRVGLKAGANTDPFLLQVYRRDMGGGAFMMMKDLSAPIHVNGRHWGGLRLAYKI